MTTTPTLLSPLPHPLQLHFPDPVVGDAADPSALAGMAVGASTLAASQSADTQGWDTVFAIRLTDVNRTLTKPGVSPSEWSVTVNEGVYFGSGTFGPWEATQGGSAAILRMSAPIPQGSVSFDVGATPQTYALAGGTVYFQVYLTYLPQPDASSTAGNNNLIVKSSSTVPHVPVVVVDDVDYGPNPNPGVMGDALVKGALQSWMGSNIGAFEHIFSTVDLAAKADKGAFQWLMPTHTSYAYLDGADMDSSFFGVLTMCENHDPGTNAPQLSAGAIPAGSRAGFSISQDNVLEQMILPAMVASFDKADSSYFAMANLNTEIVATKHVPLDSVSHGGINYHPTAETLEVSIDGGVLQLHTIVHVNISPGIDAYVETTSYKTIGLAPQSNGGNTLTFLDVKPALTHTWTEVSTGIVVTEAVIAIIGAVAGIVVGVLGQTAKFIIAAIIVAILFGVAALIPTLIEKFTGAAVLDDLPPVNDLIASPTAAIKWPAAGVFNVTAAGLNGALVLGGDPNFS